MYYVYLLKSREGKLYFGSTNDLKRRLSEHVKNKVYSTRNGEWELYYYEAHMNEHMARMREKRLKQHGNAKRALLKRINLL